MAWARPTGAQTGAELNTTAEWITIGAGAAPSPSSTKAYTGSYSIRFALDGNHKSAGKSFSSAVMMRVQAHFNHNDKAIAAASNYPVLFRWTSSAGNTNYIRWNAGTDVIELVINNSVITSSPVGTVGITGTDTWYHLALLVYADASSGWASFYVDGTKKLSATGQNTGTGISEAYCGGAVALGWANYLYVDDFAVDTSSSEQSDAAPSPVRFLWSIADANGTNSVWTGSDGNSTDNYLLVDDTTPDDDTTYVYTQASTNKDTYGTASITVPTGYSISAAIPVALSKRSGSTEQLKLLAYDGANTTTGSAQDPSTSYAPLSERMTTQPDGTDWNETDFNAMEFGIESAGTF